MGKKDPRVDAYIAKSADFAKPILKHLRSLVHQGCPSVQETIKWGVPSFEYEGMLCGMAAFKARCGLNFWNRALKIPEGDASAGQFGRITSLADLPRDAVLVGYIREAARLNETGEKLGPVARTERKPIPVPAALKAALKKKPRALAQFEKFSPEPAARLLRVDRRRQDGRHAGQAPGDRGRVDRRGQAADVEVHAAEGGPAAGAARLAGATPPERG